MGKTNILDAIYYLAMGKSYMVSNDKTLVYTDQSFFRLDAIFEDNGDDTHLVIKYRLGAAKEIVGWDTHIKTSRPHWSDSRGFITQMMYTICWQATKTAGVFINNTMVQYDANLEALTLYNRNLKQRNALLRDFADKQYWDQDLIDVITSAMAAPTNYIYRKRKNYKLFQSGLTAILRSNQ